MKLKLLKLCRTTRKDKQARGTGNADSDSDFDTEEQFLALDDIVEGMQRLTECDILLQLEMAHKDAAKPHSASQVFSEAGGPEIDLQEKEAGLPPTPLRPPISITLLGKVSQLFSVCMHADAFGWYNAFDRQAAKFQRR